MSLRTARPADGRDVAEIYAPVVRDTCISFEDTPPSADEMRDRIKATLNTHPWLVVELESKVVAYAYASQHRSRSAYKWSCDVSVYVGERARGGGLATKLYQQLFRILERQGFRTAFAGITLPNDPSVGFHTRMGFEPIGIYPNVGFKHGVWRDVGWWGRELQALNTLPSAPIPFSELDD